MGAAKSSASPLGFLKSEAGALLLWIFGALLLAAIITPPVYAYGKGMIPQLRDMGGSFESLAGSIERAGPGRFFSRALLVSALLLLYPLIFRIKQLAAQMRPNPHCLRKMQWKQRGTHFLTGLVIGVCCLGAMALVLILFGGATSKDLDIDSGKILGKAVVPALGAGIIEELVFRGIVLGLWLKTCEKWTAWIWSSLIFSFLHFLKLPAGTIIEDPTAWYAGLEVLGSMITHLAQPVFFITSFFTLAFLGLLLAVCRTITASLWLPIGLHCGLVFALKTFSLHYSINLKSHFYPWLVGNDLTKGLLPLTTLAITFAIAIPISKKLATQNCKH